MPHHILLISPPNALVDIIDTTLRDHGYPLTRATQPQGLDELEHPPAICVVNMQTFDTRTEGSWEKWLQDCRKAGAGCLAFVPGATCDRDRIAALTPLSDTLTDPSDPSELLGKINSLLTVRKLTRQLEESRHLLSEQQNELQEALQSAALIQRSLIPSRCPSFYNLHYAWRFMPCKQVGGDLFNIVQLDEETIMTYLVDVSGHGISSAMVTVSVHQSLSLHTGQLIKRPLDHPPYYQLVAPAEVLKELEAEYPFERFEEFFTISYLLLDPRKGTIRYCNAGHPAPILLRTNGEIERLSSGGTVIGMGSLIEFEEGEAQLTEGDRLFLYTDGITEYCGDDGLFFSEERFIEALQITSERDLEDACQGVINAMRAFGNGGLPQDDVTLIGIEFSNSEPKGLAT